MLRGFRRALSILSMVLFMCFMAVRLVPATQAQGAASGLMPEAALQVYMQIYQTLGGGQGIVPQRWQGTDGTVSERMSAFRARQNGTVDLRPGMGLDGLVDEVDRRMRAADFQINGNGRRLPAAERKVIRVGE